jgi:hypothetical protein
MAKSNLKKAAAPAKVAATETVSNEWQDVFDAHPTVDEIFIGTNEQGDELAFLAHGQAEQFSAKNKAVKTVNRNAAPEAPAAEGEPADENTGEEGGEAADNADETGEEGGE